MRNISTRLFMKATRPGGVAVIVEAATDNKNRTAAEIRSIFTKNDGNLATCGSVSYMFHKKGPNHGFARLDR